MKPSKPPSKWVLEALPAAEKSQEHEAGKQLPHSSSGRGVKLRVGTVLPSLFCGFIGGLFAYASFN
jgi:hypothetical protein